MYSLKTLKYSFRNPQLLIQALTHRSLDAAHNERLEFLGDTILNLVITTFLFHRYPEASEGELSRRRATLVCEAMLIKIAQKLGLENHLRLGRGERKSRMGRQSLLGDAVEAIIGAIYLDSGIRQCEVCILDWYTEYLETASFNQPIKDAKSRLQEYLQALNAPLPQYELIQKTGASHNPSFEVVCQLSIQNPSIQFHAIGKHKTRRGAEQAAATQCLEHLEKYNV